MKAMKDQVDAAPRTDMPKMLHVFADRAAIFELGDDILRPRPRKGGGKRADPHALAVDDHPERETVRLENWYILTAQTMKRVAHERKAALFEGKLVHQRVLRHTRNPCLGVRVHRRYRVVWQRQSAARLCAFQEYGQQHLPWH